MDLTQLLLRLFVKDYRNTEDPAVRARYGKLAGIGRWPEQSLGRCFLARDAAGLPPGGAACG